MKKLFCTLLALALLTPALPALAETATETVVGTWVIHSVSFGGMPVASVEDGTYTFNADGTCTNNYGMVETWSLEGDQMTMAGSQYTCTVDGDVLTIYSAETQIQIVFVREGVDASALFPAPEGSTDPADLVGSWALDMSAAMGGLTGGAVEDLDLTYVCTFNEDGTFSMNALGQQVTGTYTAEDGVLSITPDDESAGEGAAQLSFIVDGDTLYLGMGEEYMAFTRQTAE